MALVLGFRVWGLGLGFTLSGLGFGASGRCLHCSKFITAQVHTSFLTVFICVIRAAKHVKAIAQSTVVRAMQLVQRKRAGQKSHGSLANRNEGLHLLLETYVFEFLLHAWHSKPDCAFRRTIFCISASACCAAADVLDSFSHGLTNGEAEGSGES